jgi:hypothetical protein
VDEQQARFDLVSDRLAVDRHLHWQFHGSSSKRLAMFRPVRVPFDGV